MTAHVLDPHTRVCKQKDLATLHALLSAPHTFIVKGSSFQLELLPDIQQVPDETEEPLLRTAF